MVADQQVHRGTQLLEALKRAVANVQHARKCEDELWEIEAMAKLDLAWAALMRERRQDS